MKSKFIFKRKIFKIFSVCAVVLGISVGGLASIAASDPSSSVSHLNVDDAKTPKTLGAPPNGDWYKTTSVFANYDTNNSDIYFDTTRGGRTSSGQLNVVHDLDLNHPEESMVGISSAEPEYDSVTNLTNNLLTRFYTDNNDDVHYAYSGNGMAMSTSDATDSNLTGFTSIGHYLGSESTAGLEYEVIFGNQNKDNNVLIANLSSIENGKLETQIQSVMDTSGTAFSLGDCSVYVGRDGWYIVKSIGYGISNIYYVDSYYEDSVTALEIMSDNKAAKFDTDTIKTNLFSQKFTGLVARDENTNDLDIINASSLITTNINWGANGSGNYYDLENPVSQNQNITLKQNFDSFKAVVQFYDDSQVVHNEMYLINLSEGGGYVSPIKKNSGLNYGGKLIGYDIVNSNVGLYFQTYKITKVQVPVGKYATQMKTISTINYRLYLQVGIDDNSSLKKLVDHTITDYTTTGDQYGFSTNSNLVIFKNHSYNYLITHDSKGVVYEDENNRLAASSAIMKLSSFSSNFNHSTSDANNYKVKFLMPTNNLNTNTKTYSFILQPAAIIDNDIILTSEIKINGKVSSDFDFVLNPILISNTNNNKLSKKVTIAIVVAVVAFVIIVAAIITFVVIYRKKHNSSNPTRGFNKFFSKNSNHDSQYETSQNEV